MTDRNPKQNNISKTEKLTENDADQQKALNQHRNEVLKSGDAGKEGDSLLNKQESESLKSKNKKKLESEKDEDFGIE